MSRRRLYNRCVTLVLVIALAAVLLLGGKSASAEAQRLSDLPWNSWRPATRVPGSLLIPPPERQRPSGVESARHSSVLIATAGMRPGVVAGGKLPELPLEPNPAVKVTATRDRSGSW